MDFKSTPADASQAWKANPDPDKLKGSPEAKLIRSTAMMRLSPSACRSVGLGCSVKGKRYS